MNRPNRFGHNGVGRSLGSTDTPKVARGEITQAFQVDTETLMMMQDVYDSDDKRSFMKRPGEGGFRLLKDEMAFKIRGGGDAVLTALNGLDAPLVEVYPDDPDLVRDLLAMLIQPMGVVREDARTDQNEPKVTLRVGGTVPQGAPQIYNVPGQENALVSGGCAVVYDVPDLRDPIQHGTVAGGRTNNKVTLVARSLDKRSAATRIQNILGSLIHDPAKFKRAMREHTKVATSLHNCANTIVRSYKVSLLMGIDLLLKRGILEVGQGVNAAPLEGPGSSSEDVVTRMAELLGVLDKRSVYAGLSPQEREVWTKLVFDLHQRILPVPDPTSKKYNARNEFGFALDTQRRTWVSKARVDQTGEAKRDPMGRLLTLSLTHVPLMLEAVNVMCCQERSLMMGRANSTPSNRGTGLFDLMLVPHGGLSDIN